MSTASTETTALHPLPPAAKVGLIPILLAVVVSTTVALGAVGGVAFYLVKSGKLAPVSAAGVPTDKKKEAASTEQMPGELPPSHVLALDPMVVNLSDPGGRGYLRASISLRIADEALAKGEKEEGRGQEGRTSPIPAFPPHFEIPPLPCLGSRPRTCSCRQVDSTR